MGLCKAAQTLAEFIVGGVLGSGVDVGNGDLTRGQKTVTVHVLLGHPLGPPERACGPLEGGVAAVPGSC